MTGNSLTWTPYYSLCRSLGDAVMGGCILSITAVVVAFPALHSHAFAPHLYPYSHGTSLSVDLFNKL